MAALAKNKNRKHKVHDRHINMAAADAGKVFYVGAYIVREAATAVVIPGADLAGVKPLGVVVEPLFPSDPDLALNVHLDNTSGADGAFDANGEGDRLVRYDQVGEWLFAVAGAVAPKVGDPAYLVDDNTVSAENGAGKPAVNGVIAGHFTRPGPGGEWFIDISRRGIA